MVLYRANIVKIELEGDDLMRQKENLFTNRRQSTRLTSRKKLEWPKDKPFKILSLDGGGMRGIYGATLLRYIEDEITNGKNISNYFDMIAGTSTGGIVALGLGLNIPTDRIQNIYRIDGEKIFKQSRCWKFLFTKFLTHAFSTLYNKEALEQTLKKEFNNSILGDAVVRLVIPAFMVPKAEIAVFKTDHHPDFKRDWKSEVWRIAMATSAAPTYFKGHKSGNVIFLDGGIWANNPIMIAIIDALSNYNITLQQIKILSIGTGNPPFTRTLEKAQKGLFHWRKIIEAAIFLTTDNALSQAKLLLGPDKVLRMEPSEKTIENIELDDWEKSKLILPNIAKNHFRDKKNDLEEFFIETVHPRERFYSNA